MSQTQKPSPCAPGSVAMRFDKVPIVTIAFWTNIPFDAENRGSIMPAPLGLFAKVARVGLAYPYDIDDEIAEARNGKIDKCAFGRIHGQISPQRHRRFQLTPIPQSLYCDDINIT